GDDARGGVQDLLVPVLALLDGAGGHGSTPVERGPILGRISRVFEPQFSNSTPLTWPVNRREGHRSLDWPFKRMGGWFPATARPGRRPERRPERPWRTSTTRS